MGGDLPAHAVEAGSSVCYQLRTHTAAAALAPRSRVKEKLCRTYEDLPLCTVRLHRTV